MLLLGLCLAPFAYYTLIWSNIVTGLNRAVLSYRISSVFSGVNLAAVLLLWALGYLGAGSVVVVTQSLALLNALLALIILLRIEPRLSPSLELARNSLRYQAFKRNPANQGQEPPSFFLFFDFDMFLGDDPLDRDW